MTGPGAQCGAPIVLMAHGRMDVQQVINGGRCRYNMSGAHGLSSLDICLATSILTRAA